MILLGKRIKELRNKSKLTQTQLAEQVGVTKSTIVAYENDSRLPSYEVLIKMSKIFRVTTDSLLLNRNSTVIDIDGLTDEQIEMIEKWIYYFKENNEIIEIVMNDKNINENMKERLKQYYDRYETLYKSSKK